MLLLFIALIAIMAFLGAPIFIFLSAFAIAGFIAADIPLSAITVDVYNNFANNPLLYTIPLFTLAGYILAESKASNRLVNMSRAVLGFVPGGLAIVALVCCAFFTAFTGASGVTIVALGGLLFPALLKEKYPEKFSLGLLTSSGSLGLLFVPSLPLIMYAVVSQSSVKQVFAAGLVPGVLLIVVLAVFSGYVAVKEGIASSRTSLAQIIDASLVAKWEIAIPFIIIGGLFTGFVTLGEVATLTVAYVFFIEVFVYKDIPLHRMLSVMSRSITLTGGMLIIMGAAYSLTNYMVDAEIPMAILSFIRQFISSRWIFLILLNVFLLIVGCFLDIYSATFVVVPLIIPLANHYGVDPVHLGIIFLTNMEIGYLTPPVGLNLFIASLRFERPIIELYRASIPFIIALLLCLVLITYIPGLSLGIIDLFQIR
ncbi:MAG: TRAP transporter large permease subunit [Desulfobacteraceae bacterium]|jgi:tripartite ATP-independent transporter DctM subunit